MDRYISNFMKHKYKPEKMSTHSTEFCKDILEKIIQKKGFTNPKVIQEDKFTATITVDNNTNQKMTLKIVQDPELAEKEKLLQNLHHHHVLPLVSYEYCLDAKAHLFYSPLHFSNLKDLLANKKFKNNPDAIKQLIIWCKEAASAIQYVHKSGYQHMNISTKSIAITKDEIVKITDFGYLQNELENNNSYGVASHACPPEIYSRTGRSKTGDGKKFDTYCFGIMMLEAFTGSYVEKKLSNPVKSWTKDAYPVIFKALRGDKFIKLVTKQFPKASQDTDLTNIRNLIASTLRFHAQDRPDMKEIFLKLFELSFLNDFWIKPNEDEIWQKKVSYKELKHKLDNMALQNQPAILNECSCDSNKGILTEANDIDLKIADTHPCFQSPLNSRRKKDIFVEATDEIEVVQPRDTISDCKSSEADCSEDHEERKPDYVVPGIRNINMDKGMMGDHGDDTESKNSVEMSFEHEELSFSEISARESLTAYNTKEEMGKIEIPSPFDEDDENNSLFKTEDQIAHHTGVNKKNFKQISEVFEYDQQSKDADLRQNEENASMEEKEKTPDSNEEMSKTIYTVKRIFTNAFKWVLDEHLYSGVMNTGSYINKLSEALTN